VPTPQLRLPCALDQNVEIQGWRERRGKEVQDFGEEGGGGGVDFVVEDVVEEDFEGVRKVGEVAVLVGEVEGCWGVVLGELVAEDVGEE
jgi:hypothetical protein